MIGRVIVIVIVILIVIVRVRVRVRLRVIWSESKAADVNESEDEIGCIEGKLIEGTFWVRKLPYLAAVRVRVRLKVS